MYVDSKKQRQRGVELESSSLLSSFYNAEQYYAGCWVLPICEPYKLQN